KKVVERVADLGVFRAKTLAAHCVHVDSDQIRMLREHGVAVAHNPTSNLKLARGIAPIKEMLERGDELSVGTDGAASNNDLDMFEEMRLAALLVKGATFDPVVLPARDALLMATRWGAEALTLGDITGSLEPGKRADLIVVDRDPLHNAPHFERDANNIYSQLVYATHASAVQQEESFEIQVKARVDAEAVLEPLLNHPAAHIVKHNHYRQYDTYFLFADENQGRVRYREDHSIDARGQATGVRTRLTYTTPTKEREFESAVLLSRSRFIAPADRPLRFYREYFQARNECEIQKDRMRWHILYQGVLFYVNFDRMMQPQVGEHYVEIKARTWSQTDAEYKAELANEMLTHVLGVEEKDRITTEYVDLCAGRSEER